MTHVRSITTSPASTLLSAECPRRPASGDGEPVPPPPPFNTFYSTPYPFLLPPSSLIHSFIPPSTPLSPFLPSLTPPSLPPSIPPSPPPLSFSLLPSFSLSPYSFSFSLPLPLSLPPSSSTLLHRQCHRCCFESGDDMAPTIANFDEPASRCGRKINAPKVFTFPDDQVNIVIMLSEKAR